MAVTARHTPLPASSSSIPGGSKDDVKTNLTEQIRASLKAHNESFEQLLRIIPAQYYLQQDEDTLYKQQQQSLSKQVTSGSVSLTKSQKKAAAKELKKEKQDEHQAKSEAFKKAKLARYDPDEPKTIAELQRAKAVAAESKGKAKADSEDEDDVEEWEEISDNDVADDDDDAADQDSPNDSDFQDDDDGEEDEMTGLPTLPPRSAHEPAPTVSELKERLHNRIRAIQEHKRIKGQEGLGRNGVDVTSLATNGKRKIAVERQNGNTGEDDNPGDDDDDDDEEDDEDDAAHSVQSKEDLLEETRRRRGLLRDNRRKKRKAQRKEDGKYKAASLASKEGKERNAPSNGRKGGGKANAPSKEPRENRDRFGDNKPEKTFESEDRPGKKVKRDQGGVSVQTAPIPTVTPSNTVVSSATTPASTDPSSLTFSTLDFSTTALLNAQASAASGSKNKLNATVKKNRHALPKDANAALDILQARKQRLDKLDPEQREKKEDKDRWEKVTLKAEGEKVRDDEKRLKKMAKRQEKVKAKSAKAWAERKETVSSNISAKISKRNNNLAARAKAAKDKKMGIKNKSSAKSAGKKTTSKSFASRNKSGGSGGSKGGRPGFEGKGKGKKK